MPPSPENNYQVGPTEKFSRALWNAAMASLAARLAAREALEADFEALISGGTQAALDLISQNVAPQLESLLAFVTELEEQVDEVIGSGNAPNALKLGGNLPEFYLALANATGTLPYNKVAGIDAAIANAVAGLVNSAPGALDTLGELAAALGNDPNAVTNILTAMGNRLRFDAAQALTGPQVSQALDNLGFSTIGKLLKAASTEAAARAAIVASAAHGFVEGLTLSNNVADATNDVDIGVGAAQLGSVYVASASTLTKRLDAAWAAGNNAGGLDTGSKANSTTYHLHALRKTSDGSFDALFSLSSTAPTIPSGYTAVQRLGAVITDGSGAIRPFLQDGNEYRYRAASGISAYSSNAGRALALLSVPLPTGIRVLGLFHAMLNYGSSSNPATTGSLIMADGNDISVVSEHKMDTSGAAASSWGFIGMERQCRTNLSGQIHLGTQYNVTMVPTTLAVRGWIDETIPRMGR